MLHDLFKKPARPPTPDPKWNQGKSVDNEPTQTWLNDLANAEKPTLTFNELMSTPIDFSAFAMNRLKINNLTKADLVGPVYNLLKGTCKSYVKLEYNMENVIVLYLINWIGITLKKSRHDVYSTMRILSMTSVTVEKWYGYGYLKEIVIRRVDQKLYKLMKGNFPRLNMNDIEDMLLLVAQNKLNTLDGDVIVHLGVGLHIAPYTTLSDPQGVIYKDKLKNKRLMRTEELYKFSDDTLTSVRNTLDQMLKNLRLGYNKDIKRRKCTTTN
nr:hypothetical protein [Tanacetum cinerariifolium]